ncbi:MAG: superoxide dismutase family protein [Propionibacteriaceae bacterium]
MKLRRIFAVGTATLATALAGVLLIGPQATAHNAEFRAKLRDPSGRVVGTVQFRISRHATEVDARLRPNANVTPNQFHGFHVHANSDPANGQGCVADGSSPRSTWFVSADGHLSAELQTHGQHQGDLPSPLVLSDGTARLSFTTDRIEPWMLRGRAVVLHANPDNFGNVPTGTAPNQYTPGATAADLTNRTGNAGDRVACGVVQRSR